MVNWFLRFMISILVTAITVFVLAQYLPGLHITDSRAIEIGVSLGFFNRVILGFFNVVVGSFVAFFINASTFLFWTNGITDADGFHTALIASLIVSIVTGIINRF